MQVASLFLFFGAFFGTQAIYERLLANSTQLAQFNSCGDQYMKVDMPLILKNLELSQEAMMNALYISGISLLAFFVQICCVIVRLLRLCKPQ